MVDADPPALLHSERLVTGQELCVRRQLAFEKEAEVLISWMSRPYGEVLGPAQVLRCNFVVRRRGRIAIAGG